MELTEEKIVKAKSYNAKLFPIYKMFSWDLLFYYSISFLFLTQTKNLTASQVLFSESFYPLFKLVFQIPGVNIIESIGRRKSLILANLSLVLSILVLILGKSLGSVIFCNMLMGFGYCIKAVCEPAFLNECVSSREHSRTVFSNLDGKGSAYWYYFDAITAIFCGYLYVFNNYLPIFLCLGMCIIGTILSFKFLPYETGSKNKLEETGSFKEYVKDLRTAFKNILHSNRLKALLLCFGTFAALLAVRSTIASSLFTEIGVPEKYFGVIFSALTILSGISSKGQNLYHRKFRNKVLTIFSLAFSLSMVVIGLTAIISKNLMTGLTIILIAYAVQYIIKGPYYTLQKRYLTSFSSPSMSTKIYSACYLIESVFSTITYLVASYMLGFMNTSFVIVIFGCIFTVAFIFILDYMRDKVGLKPEEYKKADISFTEVH